MLFTKPHITENVKPVNEKNLENLVEKYRNSNTFPLAKIYISWSNFLKLSIVEISGVRILPGTGLQDYEVHLLT